MQMRIPPSFGKARAVLKLQSLAIGMKSKTESEGMETGRRGGKGAKETDLAHLNCLFSFLTLFFTIPSANRFLCLLKNTAEQKQTKNLTYKGMWLKVLMGIFWTVWQGATVCTRLGDLRGKARFFQNSSLGLGCWLGLQAFVWD